MSELTCASPVTDARIAAYWLGELDEPEAAAVEDHFFGCAHCTRQLQRFQQLATGIRRATLAGNLHAVLSASFVSKLREDGLRIREYRLQPGTSVACTVTPDDDLVVSYLQVPLAGVQRLDLIFEDLGSGMRLRLEDIGFDPARNEVVLAPNTRELRQLGTANRRMRLLAVQDGGEHELGSYTFNHSRFSG